MKIRTLIILLALVLGYLEALAQVDTAWVRKITYARQETPLYGAGRLLALDKQGNIYLGAYGNPVPLGNQQYVIAKYNSCGDTLWVKRVSAGAQGTPRALTVDDSGYVYVTGQNLTVTSTNYFTVKFKPNGDTAWTREYTGPNNNDDNPTDIALDKNRNVIVTGFSSGTGPVTYDYATIKYATNGDTVWVRRYNSGLGNSDDRAMALAVDTAGNVYVTGRGETTVLGDYVTIKYSSTGNILWTKSYAGPGGSLDETNDLALDALGNVYVTGGSYGGPSGQDFATIKYTPNGDTLWVRRYTSLVDSFDVARALEVDQVGNVYVTGKSASGGATVKYDANGNELWVRRYSLADLVSLALDQSGNPYVTGSIYAGGSNFAILTVRYNPNGDTAWSRQYLDPATIYNSGSGNHVAIDTAGDVYVGGNAGYDPDVTLIKYSTNPPCPPHGTAYTPSGTNVGITPYPGVSLLFRNVSSPGNTTVTLNPTGPTPPSNYTLIPTGSPIYYDIQTTATYTDSVYVCITYADSVVPNEDSLKILHYNGSSWDNVTVFHDKNTNLICGGGTLLSPFALAVPGTFCTAKPGDVTSDGKILLNDIIALINHVFRGQPAPVPFCRGDVNGNGNIVLQDIIYLINFLFRSGPAPVKTGACCL